MKNIKQVKLKPYESELKNKDGVSIKTIKKLNVGQLKKLTKQFKKL